MDAISAFYISFLNSLHILALGYINILYIKYIYKKKQLSRNHVAPIKWMVIYLSKRI